MPALAPGDRELLLRPVSLAMTRGVRVAVEEGEGEGRGEGSPLGVGDPVGVSLGEAEGDGSAVGVVPGMAGVLEEDGDLGFMDVDRDRDTDADLVPAAEVTGLGEGLRTGTALAVAIADNVAAAVVATDLVAAAVTAVDTFLEEDDEMDTIVGALEDAARLLEGETVGVGVTPASSRPASPATKATVSASCSA